MKEKDYKAISGIMKSHVNENENDRKSIDDDRCDDVYAFINTISNQLANYFESEENKKEAGIIPKRFDADSFKKEQFLKDCGVEYE